MRGTAYDVREDFEGVVADGVRLQVDDPLPTGHVADGFKAGVEGVHEANTADPVLHEEDHET